MLVLDHHSIRQYKMSREVGGKQRVEVGFTNNALEAGDEGLADPKVRVKNHEIK